MGQDPYKAFGVPDPKKAVNSTTATQGGATPAPAVTPAPAPASPAVDPNAPIPGQYTGNMTHKLNAREQERQRLLGNYMNKEMPAPLTISGNPTVQAKTIDALNLSKLGYGQNLGQTGEDIQRVKDLQKARTEGSDAASVAIRNANAGTVANAQRQMASQGIAGGAASGALANIERAGNADVAASLYGQQASNIAAERSLASNMLAGTTSLMQGGKAEGLSLTAPSSPSGGGTSFICTKLRSKGLMTRRESLIMTKFMLKSLITRADFLVWYFQEGKAATDRAEAAGFDWSSIKVEFVDSIIDLLKQDKFIEAQDLYILKTGFFCTQFGAEGFETKLATRRFIALFNFPRLFLIDNCRGWLKSNFRAIPKILKAELV